MGSLFLCCLRRTQIIITVCFLMLSALRGIKNRLISLALQTECSCRCSIFLAHCPSSFSSALSHPCVLVIIPPFAFCRSRLLSQIATYQTDVRTLRNLRVFTDFTSPGRLFVPHKASVVSFSISWTTIPTNLSDLCGFSHLRRFLLGRQLRCLDR